MEINMENRWKITSDGTSAGTRVYDPSGADVTHTIGSIVLRLEPGKMVRGEIGIALAKCDIVLHAPAIRAEQSTLQVSSAL